MVEEDLGSDVLAIARLELLSNTAMLKKVLDKQRGGPPLKEDSPRVVDGRNDGVSTSRGDNDRQRQYHPLEAANASTTRPPSTSTNDSEIMTRRDASAMPHNPHHHPTTTSMDDAPHDISPHLYEPPRYAPPVPSGLASVYHFNTANSPRDCPPPQMHGRPSPYPGETATSGYMHGPHGEIYFLDSGRLESSPGGAVPHISPHHHIHHHAGAVRAPYLKENVPPQHRYRHHPHHPHPYSTHSSSMMERQTGGHHMLADGGAGVYTGGRPDRLSPLPRSSSSDEAAAAAVVVADSMNRYEGLARENHHMREQLKEKDVVVSSLQQRVAYLENQINELRQLPTGKISHIAVRQVVWEIAQASEAHSCDQSFVLFVCPFQFLTFGILVVPSPR
jgi:hypothetical protein